MTTYFDGPLGKTIKKDPQAVLDYPFDWSSWLATAELIVSHIITVAAGITKDSDNEAAGVVTVVLSGGTAGTTYKVACRITTDSSPARTDERTIYIEVVER